jgi:hypothetical protein
VKKFIVGVFVGSLLTLSLFFLKDRDEKNNVVKITQITGEPIYHENIKTEKGILSLYTVSEGAGIIKTEIPITNIPEAKAWIEKNHSLMLELLFIPDETVYGVSYMRRFSDFSVGGGILVSEKGFKGVKAQAQYWFKI